MSPLDKKRKVWIYLPEIITPHRKIIRLSICMMLQNLFDQALSYSGEWEVDETLDKLAKST